MFKIVQDPPMSSARLPVFFSLNDANSQSLLQHEQYRRSACMQRRHIDSVIRADSKAMLVCRGDDDDVCMCVVWVCRVIRVRAAACWERRRTAAPPPTSASSRADATSARPPTRRPARDIHHWRDGLSSLSSSCHYYAVTHRTHHHSNTQTCTYASRHNCA